jgi:hypothetical protein
MKNLLKTLYNIWFASGIVAVVALLIGRSIPEAGVLVLLALVITKNHAGIERRMAFGARASLPDNRLYGKLEESDVTQIRGNYMLNLVFFLGGAAIALLAAKNAMAAILLLIQSKLIVEQHRELPNRIVVGAAHTLPAVIFFVLIPAGMTFAKIFSGTAIILLLLQGVVAIKILNDSDIRFQ